MIWKLIGISASFLTMFGFVPQAVKMLKTKSAENISLVTLIQIATGVFLWLLYGLHLRDFIIVLANGVTFSSLIITVIIYLKLQK